MSFIQIYLNSNLKNTFSGQFVRFNFSFLDVHQVRLGSLGHKDQLDKEVHKVPLDRQVPQDLLVQRELQGGTGHRETQDHPDQLDYQEEMAWPETLGHKETEDQVDSLDQRE